jgi:hypothetical protein
MSEETCPQDKIGSLRITELQFGIFMCQSAFFSITLRGALSRILIALALQQQQATGELFHDREKKLCGFDRTT